MRKISGFLADTTELRKVIMEYPDYPIAVMCGENVNNGEYSWMCATDVTFKIGEVLDTEQPIDECVIFTDRDNFEEQLEEWLWDKLSEEGEELDVEGKYFQEKLLEEKAKYEPYWKDCIFIYADN